MTRPTDHTPLLALQAAKRRQLERQMQQFEADSRAEERDPAQLVAQYRRLLKTRRALEQLDAMVAAEVPQMG